MSLNVSKKDTFPFGFGVNVSINAPSVNYQQIGAFITRDGVQRQYNQIQTLEIMERLVTYVHMAVIQWMEEVEKSCLN